MYSMIMLFLVGLLSGTAEAKAPWRGEPHPQTTEVGTPVPVAEVQPTVRDTKAAVNVDYLAKYQEAQRLFVPKNAPVDDVVRAAMLFAEVASATDENLRSAGVSRATVMSRFDKAVARLIERDSSSAVTVVVNAWRTFGRQADFSGALDKVYETLTKQVQTNVVTVASTANVGGATSCDAMAKHLSDLVVISGEVKLDDNPKWRTQLAQHHASCSPTMDSLGRAYKLYYELGKSDEAQKVAVRLGDAYLQRFTSGGTNSWNVTDLASAADYYGKADIDLTLPGPLHDKLRETGEAAEQSQNWKAALEVYRVGGFVDEAAAVEPMIQNIK